MPRFHTELRQYINGHDVLSACAASARLGVASRIGDMKRAAGMCCYDAARERAVAREVAARWDVYGGRRIAPAPLSLWRCLMMSARSVEPECLALHLGPIRTHSERAAIMALVQSQRVPFASFGEACSMASRAGCAILPVHNTLSGAVSAAIRVCSVLRGLLAALCSVAVMHAPAPSSGRRVAHTAVGQKHALWQCSSWFCDSSMVASVARSASEAPSIASAAQGACAITTPALARAIGRHGAAHAHRSEINRTSFAITARCGAALAVIGSRVVAWSLDSRCCGVRHCAARLLIALRHSSTSHCALVIEAARGGAAFAARSALSQSPALAGCTR
ncbi:putative chorismate mutase/prephenate dehydratase [Candidatus Tremblaya princeps PCIT]|uniref:Putative chorismate mutase/prephenate dehydratase n=1 Tax=Tremblaya princeps (strain PCIT) TaxID=891398 RepID=F7XYC8_TREPP|nr:putative chorismate mutase/prephenate dehydratase [Candidatus Tremblaya princeps PCIT]AEK38391.1 putative prephenate dehydratase [Candidatus Tremblaya princeps PCVAL]